jgi:hypothetical protein
MLIALYLKIYILSVSNNIILKRNAVRRAWCVEKNHMTRNA